MRFFDNDRWRGEFQVTLAGTFRLHYSGLGGRVPDLDARFPEEV